MTEKFVTPGELPSPYEREVLTILMEEAAEVQQRASKILRFGRDEVQPGQDLTNKIRLSGEVGDFLALVDEAKNAGLIDPDTVNEAVRLKRVKLRIFMQTEPPETATE